MTTLREYIQAIRDRNEASVPTWRVRDYQDAVAALAILDAAERLTAMTAANWGPPNQFGQSVIRAGAHLDLGIRLVPDPEKPDA